MLKALKQLAKIVYENHNKPIGDNVIGKDYTVDNITVYVTQKFNEMNITALNIETQRNVDLTAQKYSKLFRIYVDNKVGVPTNNYKLKGIDIIFINSMEQEESKQEQKVNDEYKTETQYRLEYKYKENGNIHYRDFERMQFVDQWLNQGKERDMIKVSLEEFEVRKLKSENTPKEDIEFIEYLKAKFGRDYINKTKRAIEQLDSIKDKRSLAGRKPMFNKERINKILELRNDGVTIKDLARAFECGVATIHKLISENK